MFLCQSVAVAVRLQWHRHRWEGRRRQLLLGRLVSYPKWETTGLTRAFGSTGRFNLGAFGSTSKRVSVSSPPTAAVTIWPSKELFIRSPTRVNSLSTLDQNGSYLKSEALRWVVILSCEITVLPYIYLYLGGLNPSLKLCYYGVG